MSAMPIEWHENCLLNSALWLEKREEDLQRLISSVEEQRLRVAAHRDQIAEAKKRGKTAFDAERFMVPRKKGAAD